MTSLFEDRTGRVWVGTIDALYGYNRATNSFSRYPAKGRILGIREDVNGKLWFGIAMSPGGGIGCFDPSNQQFTYYLYNPTDKTGLRDWNIMMVLVSRSNNIWVATSGGGISRLNQQTAKFTNFQASPTAQVGHLTDKDTRALYEDAAGIIWVGTNQGGLHRLDPKTGRFTYFTTQDGLPSNHIKSIVGDDHGNLWLGTNNGLSRFNPKTKHFRNYDVSDGLPDNDMTLGTAQKRNGWLLIGTLNGYVVFHPDSVRDNQSIPPVYITALTVMNKPRDLTTNHFQLPYSDNNLSFEFVALNYNTPEKNQYAYQLEGVNTDWVYCGTRRFASFTELSPGDYVFRVKASNNDGVWNQKGTSVSFTILPPWWRTWWAYALYGLVFVGSLRAYILFRSRALRRENRVLEEKVDLRTHQIRQQNEEILAQKEEIEAQRDYLDQTLSDLKATQAQLIQKEKMASLGELTAGIAHEIQNPLNFVNNFSEVSTELLDEQKAALVKGDWEEVSFLADDLRQNLEKITHHGQRASSIVKGMLEHSRISTGAKRPTDLNALADEYLKIAYQGYRAKDKSFSCELVTEFDPAMGLVEVAPQEIGRVLLNLYNNAFYTVQQQYKTTQGDQSYVPTVRVSTHLVANGVEIRVGDNGEGIPNSIKAKIFQPFFTTKPTGEGTGLGLSLSYDIVTKGHGGSLTVQSSEGQGAKFILTLPHSLA